MVVFTDWKLHLGKVWSEKSC